MMRRFVITLFIALSFTIVNSLTSPNFIASAASPSIHIDPTIGEVNTQVTIIGENFTVGAKIVIYLGTSDTELADAVYSAATVDSNGAFTAAFVMPGTWPSGEPITDRNLVIVAKDTASSVQARGNFEFIVPRLESLGWKRFNNEKFGFTLMLPPGWKLEEYDNSFAIQIEDNPQAGEINGILTPVTQIEGGKIGSTDVRDLSLEDYAKIALNYELGGAGSFSLIRTEPFQTETGLNGVRTYWKFTMTPMSNPNATLVGEQTPEAITVTNYVAVYFDLNLERDGTFYRALEFVSVEGQQPTPGLFKSMMNSVLVSQPLTHVERTALKNSIAAYLKQSGSPSTKYFVVVTGIDGDYIRFDLVPNTPAEIDTATGFAKKSEKSWTVLNVGTQFDTTFYEAQHIPEGLRK